ncbi:MAG: nitrous oxide reductase family maturation protein NosD [Thermodesulfobacteriota bacterium]
MLRFSALAVFILGAAPLAQSLEKTIRVTRDGPVRSISEAIDSASAGDTIIVDGGVYRERVVADKKLRLIGVSNPVIDGGGTGTVVEIKAPGSVIKGFTVTGSGSHLSNEDTGILVDSAEGVTVEENILTDVLFGIYIKNAPHTVIRGNTIRGKEVPMPERGDGVRLWYSSGTKVLDNKISGIRDVVIWWSSDTLIKGNTVEEGRYGLHYMSSNHNRFEDNVFRNNYVGGFLMYSVDIQFHRNKFIDNRGTGTGYGIGFKDLDDVVARDNLIMDNRVGIFLDNSPYLYDSWNTISDNVIAFNDIGVSFMPSIRRNAFIDNSFIDNEEQVEVRGGGRLSGNEWSREGSGNYWSDYVGYDEDGDGIGEIPYKSESLFESLIDGKPELRVFVFSPVAKAIELASQAFPVIKPEPKLTDEYPLVRPQMPSELKAGGRGWSPRLILLSLSMVIIPLVFYAYVMKR